MRILIVGSGGREHALAWRLSQEAEVHVTPGNPGIASVATIHPSEGRPSDLAKRLAIDLVVIGPEDPLIAGLADELRSAGFPVFGPGASGAQLEGSKAFSKELMAEAGVPTAAFKNFADADAAVDYARERFAAGRPVVVKASGAALGKGVIMCDSIGDAEEAIDLMMRRGELGPAGREIVLEERLRGFEFSLLTLCSDEGFWSLPPAQDHKRIFDGDNGPNTGGMGAYSPVAKVSKELIERTEHQVVAPILAALKSRGISYRGTLFSGLMVDEGQPYCIEYNARFGDPETQSLMVRLGTGLADTLMACANGEPVPPVPVSDQASLTVVIASAGYPATSQKGVPIEIGSMPKGVQVFHAGTATVDGQLVTNGGRVLGVTATGRTFDEARALAYQGVGQISFGGMQYRTDIGHGA